MVFVKYNSIKSDIFFNPIFIPGFSVPRFFRVQFQGSDPGCRVQAPGPGFRSSRIYVIKFHMINSHNANKSITIYRK